MVRLMALSELSFFPSPFPGSCQLQGPPWGSPSYILEMLLSQHPFENLSKVLGPLSWSKNTQTWISIPC